MAEGVGSVPSKGLEFFRQKLWKLELWQWAALALIALVGYWYVTKTGIFGAASSGDSTEQGTAPQSQGDLADTLNGAAGGLGSGAPDAPVANAARTVVYSGASVDRGSSSAPVLSPTVLKQTPTGAAISNVGYSGSTQYQTPNVRTGGSTSTSGLGNIATSLLSRITGTATGSTAGRQRSGAQEL